MFKAHIVSVLAVIALQSPSIAVEPIVPDIASDPHRGEITQVLEKHILGLYADDTFRPTNPISEQDFAKMLKIFALICPTSALQELQSESPRLPMSRIRAIAAILRVVAKDEIEAIADPSEYLSEIGDAGVMPPWARNHAAFAAKSNLIHTDEDLRPLQPITRSELSEILAKTISWAEEKQKAIAAAKPRTYSSLVIDCRGFEITRSMCPEILCEDGSTVYPDPKNAPSVDFVETHGLVAYARQLSDSPRTGENPLQIKAISITGIAKQTAVISEKDLQLIIAEDKKSHFLKGWDIVFLID